MSDSGPLLRDRLSTIACLWLAVAVSAAVVLATDVFLLGVLGIVFAVFLTQTSDLLARTVGISYGWSLWLVILILIGMTLGMLLLFGSQIEERIRRASSHLEEARTTLQEWVNDHPIVETAVSDLPFAKRLLSEEALGANGSSGADTPGHKADDLPNTPSSQESSSTGSDKAGESNDTAGSESDQQGSSASAENGLSGSRIGQAARIIAEIFQTTLGAVMNIAIVLFVGLFLAIDQDLYRDGFVRLLPHDRRERTREILNRMGTTLWSWLLGRFASMLITGIGTGIGLAVLGVPMAMTLGTLTGLLTFIPNIGPAIGLAIAVLVALPAGGTTAGMVVVVFLLFQLLESYVITPLIQQQQVSIPPALLITWQVLLGILTGFLGVTVATPLLALLFVVIRMAYLEDVLGEAAAVSS